MLEIEKSYHYLSKGSENEYLYILKLLKENTDLNSCREEKLKIMYLESSPYKEFYVGDSNTEF